jgi:hypothetical protein
MEREGRVPTHVITGIFNLKFRIALSDEEI